MFITLCVRSFFFFFIRVIFSSLIIILSNDNTGYFSFLVIFRNELNFSEHFLYTRIIHERLKKANGNYFRFTPSNKIRILIIGQYRTYGLRKFYAYHPTRVHLNMIAMTMNMLMSVRPRA